MRRTVKRSIFIDIANYLIYDFLNNKEVIEIAGRETELEFIKNCG